jgi:hypothetical protein
MRGFALCSRFEQQLQQAELAYLSASSIGGAMVAENYVGLPFEDD